MRWLAPGAVGVALALTWPMRGMVVGALLNAVGATVREWGEWLRPAPGIATSDPGVTADPGGLSVLASWLEAGVEPPAGEDEGNEPDAQGSADAIKKNASKARLGPVPPVAVRLNRDTVLSLANGGVVPRGISRAAAWGMPAGIEIVDGGGLGIAWFPGDRLTHVEGVPVAERGAVIQVVLQRRAQGAAVISGTLARRTKEGVKSFQLIVEQPYLEPVPGVASVPSADEPADSVPSGSPADVLDPAKPGVSPSQVVPAAGAPSGGAASLAQSPDLLPRP